jgi:hypothetical protein
MYNSVGRVAAEKRISNQLQVLSPQLYAISLPSPATRRSPPQQSDLDSRIDLNSQRELRLVELSAFVDLGCC